MLFVKFEQYGGNPKHTTFKKKGNNLQLIISEIKSEVGNKIRLIDKKFRMEILAYTFPIKALGKQNKSYVIEVTDLFLNTSKELLGGDQKIFNNAASINSIIAVGNTIDIKTNKTLIIKEKKVGHKAIVHTNLRI